MKLLAIDAACSACSAALWSDGSVIASCFMPMERGQAESLLPMIVTVMNDGGCNFGEIDVVAVTVGPGSFTGLRTGLAAARGIAVARGLPVVGVTTLETVALAARRLAPGCANELPVTVVLDTRRADLYVQRFGVDLAPLSAPSTALPEAVVVELPEKGVLLAGDAVPRILALLRPGRSGSVVVAENTTVPDAVYVAEIGANRIVADRVGEGMIPAAPLYLRPPEARYPVAGGRLRP